LTDIGQANLESGITALIIEPRESG
jgi:hypothetical protein